MRVIAGDFRGRRLVAPKTRGTRPMTDQTREALFNILGDIKGHKILDAYAGSGALGFESLSRGATSVIAIEMGKEAIRAIRENQQALDIDWAYQLVPKKVESWLAGSPEDTFDLIFAMPPYDVLDQEILVRLGKLLEPKGMMVVNYDSSMEPLQLESLATADVRTYGNRRLAFYNQKQ